MNDTVTFQITGIRSKVRAALVDSDAPDPEAVIARVRAEIDGGELEVALKAGLKSLATQEQRAMARRARQLAEEDAIRAQAEARRGERQRDASQALDEIKNTHQEMVETQFFSTWKETPTGRKFLGECTAADLRYACERNAERSEALRRASERDERLADAVEAAGCETVRNLGYDDASRAIAGRRDQ